MKYIGISLTNGIEGLYTENSKTVPREINADQKKCGVNCGLD